MNADEAKHAILNGTAPEYLIVEGSLDMTQKPDAPALKALPKGLMVTDTLTLDDCSSLRALPEDLWAGHKLSARGCTALDDIPESTRVGGTHQITGCGVELPPPELLTMGEYFERMGVELEETRSWSTDRMANKANWEWEGSEPRGDMRDDSGPHSHQGKDPAWERLEDGHWDRNTLVRDALGGFSMAESREEGEVDLTGCTSLKQLPEGLHAGTTLNLSGCTALTELPEGLKVDGNLTLSHCTGLKQLPDRLEVDGTLALNGCSALGEIPETLRAKDMALTGCTGLKTLAPGTKAVEQWDSAFYEGHKTALDTDNAIAKLGKGKTVFAEPPSGTQWKEERKSAYSAQVATAQQRVAQGHAIALKAPVDAMAERASTHGAKMQRQRQAHRRPILSRSKQSIRTEEAPVQVSGAALPRVQSRGQQAATQARRQEGKDIDTQGKSTANGATKGLQTSVNPNDRGGIG